jgi:hypothetical protein
MQHEGVYGHARFGIPVGSRSRALFLRVRGWFRAKPVLLVASVPPASDAVTHDARSTSVEALLEGQRWNVNT